MAYQQQTAKKKKNERNESENDKSIHIGRNQGGHIGFFFLFANLNFKMMKTVSQIHEYDDFF